MFRIDNSTASTTVPPQKPVGIPGFFTPGTVGGQPATIVEADWLNVVQEEMMAILAAAGVTPVKGSSNQVITAILDLIANNTRQRLTGPLNLYVSPSGSDTNNGLSPSTAFATPQAAWNHIMARYDVGGQSITVNMADGSYPPFVCNGTPVGAQGASVIFQGDMVSPSSVVISQSNGIAVFVALGAIVALQGLRVQASGTAGDYNANGTGIVADSAGTVQINNVDFGTCQTAHMNALNAGAIMTGGAPYSISGNAPIHMLGAAGNLSTADSHVTLYNSPTFSTAFAVAEWAGTINVFRQTFTGAAHGPRYNAQSNGIISTNGAGANYLPGDAAGSVSTGGLYL
jgi:hypothetical protein